jgi:signal transduction histidine kinase
MKKTLLFCTLTCLHFNAYCQYPTLSKAFPDSLHFFYFNNKLGEKPFLDSTIAFFYRNITTGIYFRSDSLLNYLQQYKKLAWARDDFKSYRPTYYLLLASNARMRNKMGESLYYNEKMDKEQQKIGIIRPLNALMQICNVHATNRSYRKTVEIFQKQRNYIEKFPDLLKKGKVTSNEGINAIYLLTPVLFSYVSLKDTAKARQIISLSTAVGKELFKKIQPQSQGGTIVRFFIMGMHFSENHDLLRNFQNAQQNLTELRKIIYGPSKLTKEWKTMLETYYFDWASDHYLQTRNNDSASYYIDKYAKAPNASFDQRLRVDAFKAQLSANRGNYQNVYADMKKVVDAKDSITGTIMQEMDELLYAHTQAENDRNDLRIAEKEKKEKNIIIIAISGLSLLLLLMIYQWSTRRQRITKRRIEQLNRMAHVQVAELEEIKLNERSREQERLGRELHDQLSSSVASVKYRLEKIANQAEYVSKDEINSIKDQVSDIYSAIRTKSHEWAWEPTEVAEKSFEERIMALTEITLPEYAYQKTIEIDDDVLTGFTVADKIQILHIIQEAVINILKHARASLVNILLYNEGEEKILLIEDNGRGFKLGKDLAVSKGLGFESIKVRAQELNGTFHVESSENSGTTLKVVMVRQPDVK